MTVVRNQFQVSLSMMMIMMMVVIFVVVLLFLIYTVSNMFMEKDTVKCVLKGSSD